MISRLGLRLIADAVKKKTRLRGAEFGNVALKGIGDPLLGLRSVALPLQLARVQGLADANVDRAEMQTERVRREGRLCAADENGDHRYAILVQQ